MRDALTVIVVTAAVVAAARLLPTLAGRARRPFDALELVALFVALVVARVAARIAGASVAAWIAEHIVASQMRASGGQAILTSPDASAQLAAEGTGAAFALLAAPIAIVAIARAITVSRSVIARFAAAAVVGELALAGGAVALMRLAMGAQAPAPDDAPTMMVDLVEAVRGIADAVGVFAVAGAVAGAAAAVIAIDLPMRARPAKERRALLVALYTAPLAALILGGIAAPSPDVFSAILGALVIGIAWLIAIGLGFLARLLGRAAPAPASIADDPLHPRKSDRI